MRDQRDPVFYSCPNVHIEGRFVVSDLSVDSSSNSHDNSSAAFGFGFGLSSNIFSFGAGGGYTSVSQSTSTTAQSDQSSAVGQMRMYARIAPQAGLGVPQPTHIIVGPSLAIVEGPITDNLVDTDGVTPIRTMEVTIQLRNKSGDPISGKAISIDTGGTPWSYVGAGTTDASGDVKILLKRSFPIPAGDAPPPDRSAKQVPTSARLGLITGGLVVTF